jgi:hypothetical protein
MIHVIKKYFTFTEFGTFLVVSKIPDSVTYSKTRESTPHLFPLYTK